MKPESRLKLSACLPANTKLQIALQENFGSRLPRRRAMYPIQMKVRLFVIFQIVKGGRSSNWGQQATTQRAAFLFTLTGRQPHQSMTTISVPVKLSVHTSTGFASSQDFYVASSSCNKLIARPKSTLGSESATHSRFSLICFMISCRRSKGERWL